MALAHARRGRGGKAGERREARLLVVRGALTARRGRGWFRACCRRRPAPLEDAVLDLADAVLRHVELGHCHALGAPRREDELEDAYPILRGVVDLLGRSRHRLVENACKLPDEVRLELGARDAREEQLDEGRLLDGAREGLGRIARWGRERGDTASERSP